MCLYAVQGLHTRVWPCVVSDASTHSHLQVLQDQLLSFAAIMGRQMSVGAGRFLEQDVQVSEDTMNLNYFGTLRVLKAFLPGMVKKGSGEVVLVSSAAAVCGTGLCCSPLWA